MNLRAIALLRKGYNKLRGTYSFHTPTWSFSFREVVFVHHVKVHITLQTWLTDKSSQRARATLL